MGFMQGYAYGLSDTGARAAVMTTTLRALRRGEVKEGIARLESDLDVLIMEHWTSNRSDPPLLSWPFRPIGNDSADRKLLAQVARYRMEYPTQEANAKVRDIITSHLKGYQTP